VKITGCYVKDTKFFYAAEIRRNFKLSRMKNFIKIKNAYISILNIMFQILFTICVKKNVFFTGISTEAGLAVFCKFIREHNLRFDQMRHFDGGLRHKTFKH